MKRLLWSLIAFVASIGSAEAACQQGTLLGYPSANALGCSQTPVLGANLLGGGSLGLAGSTSGTVTLTPQAAAGTYNFNFPTSAGTSGQPLLSGGGGASAMTFGTLGPAAGGTGVANNASSTITISGSFGLTFTIAAAVNATIPSGTHTLAGLDVAQNWTATQTYVSGGFKLAGASSGTLTINCAGVCGTNTLTLPAGTTDFSATGGTSQVVKQTSVGGAFTVAQLAASDLSNGTTGTGAVALASAPTLTGTILAAGSTSVAPLNFTSGSLLTTPAAGAAEYLTNIFYTTPNASNRGVSPSVHFLSLSANQTGTDTASAQTWFPGGGATQITLPASTSYFFEGVFAISRTAGTTSHTISLLFGGTATLSSIMYSVTARAADSTSFQPSAANTLYGIQEAATGVVLSVASTSANEIFTATINGVVRINGAGTFIPQFQYSAAPGGAPTVRANTHFRMYPIGTNTVLNVGNWS